MKKDIIHIITFSIGCILIISSALKSINIYSFAIEIGEYIDLYMPQWLHGWNMLCAFSICGIEMLLGLLSLRRESLAVSTIGTFAILSFFVYLTGINVFMPSVLGSVESCGCFGEFIHLTPTVSLIKSAVMWSLYLIPFIVVLKEQKNLKRII